MDVGRLSVSIVLHEYGCFHTDVDRLLQIRQTYNTFLETGGKQMALNYATRLAL